MALPEHFLNSYSGKIVGKAGGEIELKFKFQEHKGAHFKYNVDL